MSFLYKTLGSPKNGGSPIFGYRTRMFKVVYAKSKNSPKIFQYMPQAVYAEIFRKNDDFTDILNDFTSNYSKKFRNKFFRHFWYMPNEQKVNFWL